MEYVRDSAMTALILGFFASAWFGWAQERPPEAWRVPLIVASVVSLAVAAAGGILAWANWSEGSALSDGDAMRTYGIIVGVEVAAAAAGCAVLALRGQARYFAPWVCAVVGVHFWPMAPVLESPGLYGLGVLLVGIAVAALVISRRTGLLPSAVTGAGAGTALLAFAAWNAAVAIA